MMSRLGDERGRAVLREHERITRETLKAHGGAEVKTMGDGFLASFNSVTSALECAIREVAGDELAERYRGGPWGMPDADQLRQLLEKAGFDDVRVTRDALPLSFESAAQLCSTLVASPIAAALDVLPPHRREFSQALERRVAVDDALHAQAVAHLAFARR